MSNHEKSLEKFQAELEMLKEQHARSKELIKPIAKRIHQVQKNIFKIRLLMGKLNKDKK